MIVSAMRETEIYIAEMIASGQAESKGRKEGEEKEKLGVRTERGLFWASFGGREAGPRLI